MHHHQPPMRLRHAYKWVKERRHVAPNFGFIRQLMEYDRVLYGDMDVEFFAEYVISIFGLDPSLKDALHHALLETEDLNPHEAMLKVLPPTYNNTASETSTSTSSTLTTSTPSTPSSS
eukprot:TRINITY_DN4910_c0_g1_i2.p1 TRINITY_DN4910_c0_g1~~TRINITY_DN4910_c0_g1_i2.p1  ORF type:complete len:118 (-),score=37.00 TRINITY_DN4910_c0_g1_i2:181-534(-)